MKSFHRFYAFVLLLTTVALSGMLYPAAAHTASAENVTWRKIHLQNIRPDMMAYWLDPEHQHVPAEYQQDLPPVSEPQPSNEVNQSNVSPGKPLATPPAPQFDGVLAADDQKNDLWILSSQDVFEQMRGIVNQFDKPIPSIEVSLQMVAIDDESLKTLHAGMFEQQQAKDKKGANLIGITGILPNDFQAKLGKLIKQGKAKIINASHVTTLNNFPGIMSSSSSTPATLVKATGKELPDTKLDTEHSLYSVNRFYVSVVPQLNEDKTITLSLRLFLDTTKTPQMPPSEINNPWLESIRNNAAYASESITTEANLKNNHTMVVTGNNPTALGLDDKTQNIVFFLTAHQVQ